MPPLALPWPAWHTDESREALQRAVALSDEGLVQRYRDARLFRAAHGICEPSSWRISREEFGASFEVSDNLRRIISIRFVELVERRVRVVHAARRAA